MKYLTIPLLLGVAFTGLSARVLAGDLQTRVTQAEKQAEAKEIAQGAPNAGASLPMGDGLAPGGAPIPPTQPPLTGAKAGAPAPEILHSKPKPGRPRAVGVYILGERKLAEVEWNEQPLTMAIGDSLAGWKVVNITPSGVVWQNDKSARGSHGKQKVTRMKTVSDTFGGASALTPAALR